MGGPKMYHPFFTFSTSTPKSECASKYSCSFRSMSSSLSSCHSQTAACLCGGSNAASGFDRRRGCSHAEPAATGRCAVAAPWWAMLAPRGSSGADRRERTLSWEGTPVGSGTTRLSSRRWPAWRPLDMGADEGCESFVLYCNCSFCSRSRAMCSSRSETSVLVFCSSISSSLICASLLAMVTLSEAIWLSSCLVPVCCTVGAVANPGTVVTTCIEAAGGT
mmetsp:Transcript_23351/g.59637  ORF Transcript_23351/g.59637 Transcript_23351/m.59637 type:complete len:220 (+) Transcript_23351:351-1010(+)